MEYSYNSYMRRAISLAAVRLLILVTSLTAMPLSSWSADIRTVVIRDDDIELESFSFGEGQETLIMAAGNGRPAADLEELARGIAASGIRVVTYNYRTIGASKGPIDHITLHAFADDVWRIADGLKLEKVHLAGKTFGNRVVRTAAADRPKRTLSVILIGAGGEILPSEETQALYRRYINPANSKAEWIRLQGELMFAPGNEHLAVKSADFGTYPGLAAAQMAANNATPTSEWAGGGTAPMLILVCLQDRVALPENGLKIAQERADTWLVGIPQCGHNMIFERPDDLRRLIVDYIPVLRHKAGSE